MRSDIKFILDRLVREATMLPDVVAIRVPLLWYITIYRIDKRAG